MRKAKVKHKNIQYYQYGIENKFGVGISYDEIKELNNLVKKAQRIKTTKKEDALSSVLTEEDFFFKQKSRSLNQFKSTKDFEIYMNSLKTVTQKDYITDSTEKNRKYYIDAIEKSVGGEEGKFIIERVEKMSTKEFAQFTKSSEYGKYKTMYKIGSPTGFTKTKKSLRKDAIKKIKKILKNIGV